MKWWWPRSATGSGQVGARRSDSRITLPADVVPVLGVVEQGDAVAGLGQVRPLVGADLEAGRRPSWCWHGSVVPRGRTGSRRWLGALRTSTGKATLRSRLVSCHSTSVSNSIAARSRQSRRMTWVRTRVAEPASDPDARPQRALLHHLDRLDLVEVDDLIEREPVDVPGVVEVGIVGVELEAVAPGTGGQDLATLATCRRSRREGPDRRARPAGGRSPGDRGPAVTPPVGRPIRRVPGRRPGIRTAGTETSKMARPSGHVVWDRLAPESATAAVTVVRRLDRDQLGAGMGERIEHDHRVFGARGVDGIA